MKHVLIINGHPNKQSYNYALSHAYLNGVNTSQATISQINIVELTFNPNLESGYRKRTELEPDLTEAIEKIKKADHLVWFFPVWWGGYPALMKGFIDRTFLPGITYQPIKGKVFPRKLLKGKSARIILTSDTPKWYNYLVMKSPVINQFKKGTLKYCGIKNIKVSYISPIKGSSSKFRKKWLETVFQLGKKLK